MTDTQCGTMGHDHMAVCLRKRFSWTAVIVGAFVGIGLAFLLNLFSVAIGLSLISTAQDGAVSLAIGGFLGLVIGTIASMFVTGYAAGYLGRTYCAKRNLGVLYGFTAWCLALILTIMLASSMTRYVSFYSTFVSNPTVVTVGMDKPVATNATMTSDEAQSAATNLGITSLLVFALFFIGAVSSCIGGHCGMNCCSDD